MKRSRCRVGRGIDRVGQGNHELHVEVWIPIEEVTIWGWRCALALSLLCQLLVLSLLVVLAIRNEIDMIETGKLDQYNNPLKVSMVDFYWSIYV